MRIDVAIEIRQIINGRSNPRWFHNLDLERSRKKIIFKSFSIVIPSKSLNIYIKEHLKRGE